MPPDNSLMLEVEPFRIPPRVRLALADFPYFAGPPVLLRASRPLPHLVGRQSRGKIEFFRFSP